jgi:Acetyltransferase (GNAT) domain
LNVVSPAPRELWSHVLKASPEALAFHTPQWLDCICATGVYEDASLAYEMADNRKFILPLVRRKWLPSPLTTEASPPFGWGSAGPISTEVVRREELGAILVDLAQRKALRVTVRPNPLAEQPATPPTPGTILVPLQAFVLDLEGDFEHVWTKCFKPYVRTRVHKAEAADVLAESDSEGQLVSVFYDLYLKSIDRWARQGEIPFWLLRAYLRHHESRRKFEIVAKTMRDACRIWVAWVDGKPAASIIVLTFGANAYYWRGAMDKELASPTRANYLLHARAIAQACRDGCRYYQMGETGFDPGLAQFKASFGAHPRDYVEYRIERLPITTVRNRLRDVASLAGTSGSRIHGWLRTAGPEPPPPG